MNTKKVHEKYHFEVKLQKRIINDKNFTYRNITSILNRFMLKDSSSILDVGSGVGTLDFYLAKKGHRVLGIDISTKAVNVARKNAQIFALNNVKFFIGNVNSFKFRSKFDVILCSEIIEHVEDDHKLLKDLRNHVKVNGIILITTPLDSAPLYKWGLTKKFDKRVGHQRRYNLRILKKMINESKLEIIDVIYQDGFFRNLFFVFPFLDQIVRVANRFVLISDVLTIIDYPSRKLFGPTDICLVVKKK